MTAEYFVLRIYRSPVSDFEDVLGTIEDTSSGTCWSFKNDDELHRVIDKVTHRDNEQTNDD